MNKQQHKAESERLVKAVHQQLDMITEYARDKENLSTYQLDSFMKIADITVKTAQVHATLATTTETISSDNYFSPIGTD